MTILQYIASPFWGGGEQYIFDLSIALQSQFDTCTVFVCQPGTPASMMERLQQVGAVYSLHPATKNGKFSYREALLLATIMHREEVDVLHVHDMKDYFLCAYAKLFCRRKIRLVATRHIISEAKDKASWRWVYRRIDAMLFVSQKAADAFLHKEAVKRAFRSVQVVHNSIRIPDETTETPSLRTQFDIAPSLPLVLYHGRICREKGIIQLLEALAPSFSRKYAVVLAGVVDEKVQPALDELMNHSPMAGFIYPIGFRRDITSLIGQCQLGVLPSIVPEAGGPLTLLEHLALGSAVIASDNGSQPEYAENGKEAVLLPPEDYPAWEKAIEELIGDEEKAKRIAANARKRYLRDFTYSQFIKRIYGIYTNA